MRILEVSDRRSRKAFLQVPRIIYRDDDTWVCPLDKEIESIFDPAKNVYFKHGEATRWVLYDKEGNLIGRIAGFIDRNTADKYDQSTGGTGFFECINDQEAANLLFDTAKEDSILTLLFCFSKKHFFKTLIALSLYISKLSSW